MICDIFDGILFRRSVLAHNERIVWFRRVLDVVGDRIAIEAVLILMIFHTEFPLYLYAVEGIRQAILLLVILYGYHIGKPLREPNMCSRLATFAVGLMAITWLVFPGMASILLVPVSVLGILGIITYYRTVASAV
ncbi:hypothetical protein HY416_04355 [Candidatus Kaiserbacteria bacterium]|nr:hypothetical protein [Candidatus Kaiserbacteria bacterium]